MATISFDSPAESSEQQKRHVVLFPFMSKGHTIPLLQLSRLLLRRGIAVTVLTTDANRPFVAASLAGTAAAVIALPFSAGDALPFVPFANATELMRPHFERALESLSPRVSFLVSDGFLWWTRDSAARLGVPRLVFYGMSCHAMSVARDAAGLLSSAGEAETTLPSFPWIRVTARDFDPGMLDPNLDPAHSELIAKCSAAAEMSSGMVVNSWREMEAKFHDHWNRKFRLRAWCVGPLCLADWAGPEPEPEPRAGYLRWLDERAERGRSVLYVAFGSQAEISAEQTAEIERGLEESGVDFLWAAAGSNDTSFGERGLAVSEWVDQRRVLGHESVRGFLSHCGWNSVAESLCAAVPILAWPLAAEQPLNARMVAEELRVGVRVVEPGRVKGFVTRREVASSVREFMGGGCEEMRENVARLAAAARSAVAEGGSSWVALERLVEETTCMEKRSEN